MKLLSATSIVVTTFCALTSTNLVSAQSLNCSFQRDVDVLGDGSLLFRQYVNQVNQTVTVQLEYAGIGWLGVAFSNSTFMIPNTASIGLPDADTVIKHDLSIRGISGVLPAPTARQTLIDASIVQENGSTILTFTKLLTEDGEVPVAAGNNIVNWAYGSSNTLAYHARRGSLTYLFTECPVVSNGQPSAPAPTAVTAPTAPAPTAVTAPTAPAPTTVTAPTAPAPTTVTAPTAPAPTAVTAPTAAGPTAVTAPTAAGPTSNGGSGGGTALDCSFPNDMDVLGDGTLMLRQVINQVNKTVTTQIEYAGIGWVGFAFANSTLMIPNTAVIGLPDAKSVLKYDLSIRGISGVLPAPEARQTLTNTSVVQENGSTILTFTKLLTEADEVTVAAGGSTMINWSYGSSNTLAYHLKRGSTTVSIAQCLEVGQTAAPVAPTTTPPSASPVVAPTAGTTGGVIDLGNGRLQRTLSLQNGLAQLTLTTDEPAQTLTVNMVYQGIGYVAFAVSDDRFMPNSNAIMAFPGDAAGKPQKWDIGGQRALASVTTAPAARQTLMNPSYDQNNTHTSMTFTKLLTEDGEMPISLVGDNYFLYAIGGDNSFSQHKFRDSLVIDFSKGDVSGIGGGGGPPNKSLWITHGILMVISWIFLVPFAVATAVLRSFLPLPTGVWFQIHRSLNSIGVASTIAGFSIAVYLINKEQGSSAVHFESPAITHHKVGLVIFIFAILQAISGFFRPSLPHKPDTVEPEEPKEPVREPDEEEVTDADFEYKRPGAGAGAAAAAATATAVDDDQPLQKSTQRILFEFQHKIMGTIAMVMGWFNVESGINAFNLRFYGPDYTVAAWGVVGGIVGVTFFLAVYDRYTRYIRKQK